MRLLVKETELGGQLVPACFVRDACIEVEQSGDTVIIIGNKRLRPDSLKETGYEILDATPTERHLLSHGGFHLAFVAS